MLCPSCRRETPESAAVSVSERPSPVADLCDRLAPAVAQTLWRGDQLGRAAGLSVRASGFAALDAELPGGGWPCQGVTELLCAQAGTLEWRLLAPLWRRLSVDGLPVVLVAPPHRPHAPGLRALGLDERQWVWIDAEASAQRLWALEQLLRSRACGAVLAWLPQVRAAQVRRLQVLAAGARGPVFLCRPARAAQESSAAPLRLALQPGAGWTLQVDLIKRTGPPLARALVLEAVPGGLDGVLPARLRSPAETPAAPVPRTLPVPEWPHVVVRPVARDLRPLPH